MTTVTKDINEESEKIIKVKKLVKKRVEKLDSKVLIPTPLSKGELWKKLECSE